MPEPMTDREWFLVRLVHVAALMAVIDNCTNTGLPGKLVAQQLIALYRGQAGIRHLQDQVAELLAGYKPDAG